MITEETVVDVDEMVSQEEELDYDENDGVSQEKAEVRWIVPHLRCGVTIDGVLSICRCKRTKTERMTR